LLLKSRRDASGVIKLLKNKIKGLEKKLDATSKKLWLHLDEVTIYPHGSDEDDNPINDDSFSLWVAYITNDNNTYSDVLDNFIEDKYRIEYPNFTFGIYNECIVEVKHGAVTSQTYPVSFTA